MDKFYLFDYIHKYDYNEYSQIYIKERKYRYDFKKGKKEVIP